MKKFLYLACLCSMIISLASCEKQSSGSFEDGIIYGTVTDRTTGEPIGNASVELQPISLKAVTGSDGSFQFSKITGGTYRLYVTKAGYRDYSSNEIVVNSYSSYNSHSIQLEKLPPALSVVDDYQNEISAIDFGEDEGVSMLTFNLFNNSGETLKWTIVYQCDWIGAIEPQEGSLRPNDAEVIVVTINRIMLQEGENTTIVNISSNNGSRQLTIKATKTPVAPIIETLDVTNITSNSAKLNGRVNKNKDEDIEILSYGFVYSKYPSFLDEDYSCDYNKIIRFYGDESTSFSYNAENLEQNATYYVRAFVKMRKKWSGDYKGTAYYGSTLLFTTSDNNNQDVTSYYIKHPWGGGAWTWKKMELEGTEYTLTGLWGDNGANINTSPNDDDALWFEIDEIEGANYMPYSAITAKFTYNPETSALSVIGL